MSIMRRLDLRNHERRRNRAGWGMVALTAVAVICVFTARPHIAFISALLDLGCFGLWFAEAIWCWEIESEIEEA